MKRFIKFASAAGAVAVSLAAGGAAAANHSVRIGASDVRMQAIDLNLADGVAADYTVGGFDSTLASGYWTEWTSDSNSASVPGGQADAVSTTFGDRTLAASVGAGLGAVDMSFAAESLQTRGAEFYGSGKQVITLTLAPHSLLVVNGTAYTGASNWQAGWATDSEISFTLAGADNTPVSSTWLDGRDGVNYLLEQDLQLAYANVTDKDLSVTLTISTYMAVAAVPEPSTWLMLGAGVAVIGFAGRRRKHA